MRPGGLEREMEQLSEILWRERELLEALLYRLEMEQLVLASGRTRWLAPAARDVESVLIVLRETEVVRAVVADEAAASIGLTHNPSLRALADALDEPWRSIMLDHRDAFASLAREVEALADANRDLLTSGLRSAREALLALQDGAAGYAPDGAAVSVAHADRLLDRSL